MQSLSSRFRDRVFNWLMTPAIRKELEYAKEMRKQDAGEEAERKARMPMAWSRYAMGQPRIKRDGNHFDPDEMRMIAGRFPVSLCTNRLLEDLRATPWSFVPLDSKSIDEEHLKYARKIFGSVPAAKAYNIAESPTKIQDPDRKQHSFLHKVVQVGRDILELDAGVFIKYYGRGTMQNIMVSIEPSDGSTFYKEVSEFGRHGKWYDADKIQYEIETPTGQKLPVSKSMFVGYWHYSYAQEHKPTPFGLNEVVYIAQHPNTWTPYGLSKVEEIQLMLRTFVNSLEANENYFREGGQPSGVLSFLNMTDPAFEDFKTYYETSIKPRMHKFVMINKESRFTPFQFSARDMQFLEGQQWYVDMVCAQFGVPKSELGIATDVNKAVSETMQEIYIRKALYPFLRTIEDFVNIEIIGEMFRPEDRNGTKGIFAGEDPDFRFRFDLVDMVEEARALELDTGKLKQGLMTVNEWRAKNNLKNVSWGDANPQAIENIQQMAQAAWYGTFDVENMYKMLGLPKPEEAAALLPTPTVEKGYRKLRRRPT